MTTKVHLIADGHGRPLGMMITGGNVNDTTMMTAVLENIRVPLAGLVTTRRLRSRAEALDPRAALHIERAIQQAKTP